MRRYRFDMPGLKNTVSGRVEREQERFAPEGSFADGRERERGRVSYTGEWNGGLFDRLFLTAGIRRDDNDNFEDFTTWRGSASLVLREINMRPHASVGTAVKLPTMFEQFGSDQFFAPNPNLTPEHSFGWDAGVEFTFDKGRLLFDVTYFRANLTDKINGFVFDPAVGKFTASNLPGESTREGVEISARYKLASNVSLGGAYTYTDARDPNGEREIRRSPHSARADVAYTFNGGAARRHSPPSTTARWTTACSAWSAPRFLRLHPRACLPSCRSLLRGGPISVPTGSSTPLPATSCSRALSCSDGWRISSTSIIKRRSASRPLRSRPSPASS